MMTMRDKGRLFADLLVKLPKICMGMSPGSFWTAENDEFPNPSIRAANHEVSIAYNFFGKSQNRMINEQNTRT